MNTCVIDVLNVCIHVDTLKNSYIGCHLACAVPVLLECPEEDWFCETCALIPKDSLKLKTPVKIEKKEQVKKISKKILEGNDVESIPLICTQCNKSFKSAGGLRYHTKNVCFDDEEKERRQVAYDLEQEKIRAERKEKREEAEELSKSGRKRKQTAHFKIEESNRKKHSGNGEYKDEDDEKEEESHDNDSDESLKSSESSSDNDSNGEPESDGLKGDSEEDVNSKRRGEVSHQ